MPKPSQISERKKVLLITYEFPPSVSIGAVRPAGLLKYLPEFGWDAVVLTPRKPARQLQSTTDVIETDCTDVLAEWKARLRLKRNLGLHEQLGLSVSSSPERRLAHTALIYKVKNLLAYPDANRGWIPFATRAQWQLRERNQIPDAIISTAPPFTCHLLGFRAKQILGSPWIADCRDIWECGWFRKQLERRTLRHADALVGVSIPSTNALQQAYAPKPAECITNGFDPDDVSPVGPRLTDKFTITYTGQLYEGKRDPTQILEAVAELIAAGAMARSCVRLRFYGCADPFLSSAVQRLGLGDVVEVHPGISHEEALARQRESQQLLLICWSNLTDAAAFTIPGKLFEYLAARRPILSIGQEGGGVAEILRTTGAGQHVDSPDSLRSALQRSYDEFLLHGSIQYGGNASAIEHFSQRSMARKMAQLLDRTVSAEAT